ncbi:hypothetical protein REC12_05180 [Desulfosporosinus sp. PR]|nr:hypothetical protein [Desulfosporosinus sp. PR]MDQ7092974.1 hypothetical protein [Desulfosporosinus sp. PR]
MKEFKSATNGEEEYNKINISKSK